MTTTTAEMATESTTEMTTEMTMGVVRP